MMFNPRFVKQIAGSLLIPYQAGPEELAKPEQDQEQVQGELQQVTRMYQRMDPNKSDSRKVLTSGCEYCRMILIRFVFEKNVEPITPQNSQSLI